LIIFDTETTGLINPHATDIKKQPQIIEFAAIKFDDNLSELSRIQFLCNPGDLIDVCSTRVSDRTKPGTIQRITGINDEMLADEKPFKYHYQKLCDFFLGSDSILAHNCPFDCNMLGYELTRIGKHFMFPWPSKRIDTVDLTMSFRGHRLKLEQLHEMATGSKEYNAHRAMADVEALFTVVKWLVKDKGIVLK
jgi:DNA polymerase III epsilon subunit-like protein